MITPRLDKKVGTVDGAFMPGKTVVVIDDVITSGTSILDVIQILAQNGLKVKDAVALIDREQGGVKRLQENGYDCHVAFTLGELLDYYVQEGKIAASMRKDVSRYVLNQLE